MIGRALAAYCVAIVAASRHCGNLRATARPSLRTSHGESVEAGLRLSLPTVVVVSLCFVITTIAGLCQNHDVAVVSANTQLSLFEQYRFEDPGKSDREVVEAIGRSMLQMADASPPVDVEMVASACGIDFVRQRVQPWAGTLYAREGKLIASIRATDGIERRRFTVLHEGGHTFLPDFLREPQHRCKGPRTREEQLCDAAAAEMMFPRAAFLNDLRQVPPTLSGVEQLAGIYQSSRQATAIRTVSVSVTPRLLLVFRLAHKPTEAGREGVCPPKVRLQWRVSQGHWPFALPHKSASGSSPIARAWDGEQVDERADLDELFDRPIGNLSVSARRYGDHVLALVAP